MVIPHHVPSSQEVLSGCSFLVDCVIYLIAVNIVEPNAWNIMATIPVIFFFFNCKNLPINTWNFFLSLFYVIFLKCKSEFFLAQTLISFVQIKIKQTFVERPLVCSRHSHIYLHLWLNVYTAGLADWDHPSVNMYLCVGKSLHHKK